MIDCAGIQDRMPELARQQTALTEAERAHVASCEACALEWRLVCAGAALQQDLSVDTAAISQQLRARILAVPADVPMARLPWRGVRVGMGLLAAAASIVLLIGVRNRQHSVVGTSPTMATMAVLPELDPLTESQLELVLSALDVADVAVSPMRIPRLGDLTENELEQLLRDLEG